MHEQSIPEVIQQINAPQHFQSLIQSINQSIRTHLHLAMSQTNQRRNQPIRMQSRHRSLRPSSPPRTICRGHRNFISIRRQIEPYKTAYRHFETTEERSRGYRSQTILLLKDS